MLAAATGACGWFFIESIHHKTVTALSGASGAVAGLVAITPAAAVLHDWQAGVLGMTAALAVYFALQYKDKLPIDDALDVAAFHLVAGVVGSLSIGVALGWRQLGVQAIAVMATIAFSALATWVIGLLLKFVFGMRVATSIEQDGIDTVHRMSAH
jgi:Amt family ammonium transporter